jgi:hypothetical protein
MLTGRNGVDTCQAEMRPHSGRSTSLRNFLNADINVSPGNDQMGVEGGQAAFGDCHAEADVILSSHEAAGE